MTRIAIIGNAGGGKSRLASFLGARLSLPVHRVDDVQWQPHWTRAPADVMTARHAEWTRGDRWIIDGWGGWDLIEARFAVADTIVVIDYPFRVHLAWALRRQESVRLGRRADWPPEGCAVPSDAELIRTMRHVHRELRPRLLRLASEPRFASRLVHLTTPRAVEDWKARAGLLPD